MSYLSSVSSDEPPPHGPEPPDNSNRSLSFIPSVIYDVPPLFKRFGDVVRDVDTAYRRGETARVSFVGANPRNDLRLEGSYAVLEKKRDDAAAADSAEREERETPEWRAVRDDADWNLVFRWRRVSELLGTSEVEVAWETGADPWARPGRYRLRYFGDAKRFTGEITPFEGISGEFELVDDDRRTVDGASPSE